MALAYVTSKNHQTGQLALYKEPSGTIDIKTNLKYYSLVTHDKETFVVVVTDDGKHGIANLDEFMFLRPDLTRGEEWDEAERHWKIQKNREKGVAGLASEITEGYVAKHPLTGMVQSIYEIIIELNDTHHWTREQIADWLDTLPEQPKWKLEDSL